MPKVLPALNGWRVVIFPNDHRPPHVHVLGVEEHARFELLCDLGHIKLMSNVGFSLRQVQVIADYLKTNLTLLCQQWGRIHGHR